MKLPILPLLVLSAILSVVVASGSGIRRRVQQAGDQVLADGSLVYTNVGTDWYWGKIVDYSDVGYTIDWDDDDDDQLQKDKDWAYRMAVRAYNEITNGGSETGTRQVFAVGTLMYKKYDDTWYWGTISAFNDDAKEYTVAWSDGETDDFNDYGQILQMVEKAFKESHTDDFLYASDQAFLVGTYVYAALESDEFTMGTITSFDEENDNTYTVEWEDGTQETYTDVEEMKNMVTAASERASKGDTTDQGILEVFPFGTELHYYFEQSSNFDDVSGWYDGVIIDYDSDKGEYEITWSDNYINGVTDQDKVLQMVLQKISQRSDGPLPDPPEKEVAVNVDEQVLGVGSLVYTTDDYDNDTDDNLWYWGVVAGYSEVEGYSFDWQDGFSVEIIADKDWAYRMTASAYNAVSNGGENYDGNTQVFATGTKMYSKYDDVWFWGTISAYDNDGTYTVTWSDDETDDFDDFDQVLHMVQKAFKEEHSDDFLYSDGQAFLIGTYVYGDFSGDMYKGSITYFDQEDSAYKVEWEDGTQNTYTNVEDVRKMVSAATELVSGGYKNSKGIPELFSFGSEVYYFFDDGGGWYNGVMTDYDYDTGTYDVTWSDNTISAISNQSELLKMVLQGVTLRLGGSVDDPVDQPNKQVLSNGSLVYTTDDYDDDADDESWYWGKIVGFSEAGYSVDWDDENDIEVIEDVDWAYRMVATAYNAVANGAKNYNGDTDVFASGTKVYWKYDNVWWWGEISYYDHFAQNAYTVTWSDGTTDQFTDFNLVLHMVQKAFKESHSDDFLYASDQAFLVGTYVYEIIPDAIYKGSITYFDQEDLTYTVEWENGSQNTYTNPTEIRKMVSAASELVSGGYTNSKGIPEVFSFGSEVYYFFDDGGGWYDGVITDYDYDTGTYDVTWSDNEIEEISDQSKMLTMVLNGSSKLMGSETFIRNSPGGSGNGGGGGKLNAGGKAAISIFVIAVVAVAGVFGVRRYKMRQEAMSEDGEFGGNHQIRIS